jgi:RNA polymerase sigma-70 factor (ECF subfamily)
LDLLVERLTGLDQAPSFLCAEYRQHADFVWRSLQRLGVRQHDLGDALQEVFLVAHRKLGEFEGERAKFSTWLFGIAVRTAYTFKRRTQRQNQTQTLDDWVLVDATTPESVCERRESLALLQGALDELSPELRATFVLFELEGESCAAIADLFSVPVGTVYSRLHKARKRILSRFAGTADSGEGVMP